MAKARKGVERFGVKQPGMVYLRVRYGQKPDPSGAQGPHWGMCAGALAKDPNYKCNHPLYIEDRTQRHYSAPAVRHSSIGFDQPLPKTDANECVMYNPDELPRADMTDQEAYEWYEAMDTKYIQMALEFKAKL